MPSEAGRAKEGCPTILLRAMRFAGFARQLIAKQDALRSRQGEGGLPNHPASRYALRTICATVDCEAGCPPKPAGRRRAGWRFSPPGPTSALALTCPGARLKSAPFPAGA